VREDYSSNGDAWSDLPHDHARSRAYRWGEDGIAGVSDTHQYECISFAFWNEKDDFLKERLFGVTGHEGNHGEDVKEEYFFVDNTPTHSYMNYLYKYPQREYPYEELVQQNQKRSRTEPEFELVDTGVFNENRYFDIFIEMAKAADDAEEMYFRVTAYNRGPEPAPLHIVPQVWFRNTWDWGYKGRDKLKPHLERISPSVIQTEHHHLGKRYVQFTSSLSYEDGQEIHPTLLFTENATNNKRLYNSKNKSKYVKDAFHEYIVDDKEDAVNPEENGTKSCAWYAFDQGLGIPPGDHVVVRFKFTKKKPDLSDDIDDQEFDSVFEERLEEADDFYYNISPLPISEELRTIQRQAFAGMLWTKQFYNFIHSEWSQGDPGNPPPPPERANVRNAAWKHLYIDDILSMPDKWEYPFFAAWDTAFHCLPLAMVDPAFAKKQLDLLTREWYMHPNGQIPAYEWNFSDVNPPVHAWATFRIFKIERKLYGREDLDFLERVFQKLLLNFTWWVNRKDVEGKNVFEGGFLGLDNIGIFNRSEPLPTGGTLEQADSTGWMGFFSLQMLNIALELSKHRRVYEDIASKFFEHFIFIADAMSFRSGGGVEKPLWNDEDGFYYDAISWGGPWSQQLPVRSLVGLIPLYASLTLEPEILENCPSFAKRVAWFVENRSDMASRNVASMHERGRKGRLLLSLVNRDRLLKILERMLDEEEFLSDYGIRSMSKHHKDNPFSMEVHGQMYQVAYLPGESDSGLFGGNSNWRGPIWFPTTFLLIESLQRFFLYYGDDLKVECPKGSGNMMNLARVAENIQHRLISLFTRNKARENRRPYNGGVDLYDYDENFDDFIAFHEYFHGDTGRGLGSSHQCGWTGLVAKLIHDTGISITMPATPGDSIDAAERFFDDVIERSGRKPRHHSRHNSTVLKRRPSAGIDRAQLPNSGHKDASSEDMMEHIRHALERQRTGDFDDDDLDAHFEKK
jgi:hypothetical protein